MTEEVIERRTYPTPYEFDDADLSSNVTLFTRASWFDTDALHKHKFCDRYETNGYLCSDVPLRALQTVAWKTYVSLADRDLIVGHGKNVQGQLEEFTSTILT